MTGTPRILLAADGEFETRLRAAMPELNGNVARWVAPLPDDAHHERVVDLLAGGAEVIAFGPGLPLDTVLTAAATLDRNQQLLEMLVIAEPTPDMWRAAARAGIREVVSPGSPDADLAAAFRRAMAVVESRRNASHTPTEQTPPESAEPTRSTIVVRSPKGGSGKTMLSSNLAVGLVQAHPGEVAIVDLDLQFGDTATAFGLHPTYTIAHAASNAELTATSLKALLAAHSSGVNVLCAPADPTEADDFTADDVTALLGLLQEAFRYVVVDTAGGLDEVTLAALEAATDVVLVCSRDVSSVRALRKELEALDAARLTTPRRHVVLNRSDSQVGLEVSDIEATIGARVQAHVPSSRSVPLHMNCGTPILLAEPGSAVVKHLREVIALIDPAPVTATRPRSRWRRR